MDRSAIRDGRPFTEEHTGKVIQDFKRDGFVVVPALTRWLGVPLKRALGTSLVVVAVLAVPGTIAHYVLGHVDLGLAAWLIVGTVPGAWIGARLTAAAKERTVAISFSVVLAVAGLVLAGSELAAVLAR